MASYDQLSEEDLLPLLREGNQEAFTQLFYAHKAKLFSFVFDLTQSQEKAEDIVQDVFLKIWQQRGRLTIAENFNAYVFRMAQNHVIDQLRRLSRETLILCDIYKKDLGTADNPEYLLEQKELAQKIKDAVEALPPQQKKIFVLHKEKGLRHEDIAKELNLSVSTVQNHMFRAIENIRKNLRIANPEAIFFIAILIGFHFI